MNTELEHPVYRAARVLAEWAVADSNIHIDQRALREHLADDSERAGYLPDDDQCAEFIMGGDDGAPPPKLVADFPKTNAFLESYWE